MSRHHGPRPTSAHSRSGTETRRAREKLLCDVSEGLELSSQMMHLAEGPWKGAGQSGRLPIQHILRDCAQRIAIEAGRCRQELEGGGHVKFGEVVLEEEDGLGEREVPTALRVRDLLHPWLDPRRSSGGPAGTEAQTSVRMSDLPHDWFHPQDSEAAPALPLQTSERPALKTLARIWATLLALPALAGIRWEQVRSKQEGG